MSFLNVCRTGGHIFHVPLSLREAVLHGPPLADPPNPRAKVGFFAPKLGLWLSATHLKWNELHGQTPQWFSGGGDILLHWPKPLWQLKWAGMVVLVAKGLLVLLFYFMFKIFLKVSRKINLHSYFPSCLARLQLLASASRKEKRQERTWAFLGASFSPRTSSGFAQHSKRLGKIIGENFRFPLFTILF